MDNELLLNNLKPFYDYIAFEWDFGVGKEIEVAQISTIFEDRVVVHWSRGWNSESQVVKKSDIIAIGDLQNGTAKIQGFSGKFHILLPDHPLLKLKPEFEFSNEFLDFSFLNNRPK